MMSVPSSGIRLREAAERTTDVGKILEEIQMVRVYVEDDADLRIQRQKAVGILAGFGDKVRGMPDTDLPADALQHAADRNRRIVIRMRKRISEIMEVVVVLPWVPAMATGTG